MMHLQPIGFATEIAEVSSLLDHDGAHPFTVRHLEVSVTAVSSAGSTLWGSSRRTRRRYNGNTRRKPFRRYAATAARWSCGTSDTASPAEGELVVARLVVPSCPGPARATPTHRREFQSASRSLTRSEDSP